MPPLHTKRGDASLPSRIRDLFRKRQTVGHHEQDIQEILKRDRDNLLKEIERILDGQRALETLTSLSQLNIASTYRSSSTQTEMPEELSTSATLVLEDTAKAGPRYTSSSTQVDLEVVKRKPFAIITQIARSSQGSSPESSPEPPSSRSSYSPRSVSPISNPSRKSHKENSSSSKLVKNSGHIPIPIGEMRRFPSSSSQSIPNTPPRGTADNGTIRRKWHSIDNETGVIWAWRTSRIPWKGGKTILVRLPPHSFGENLPRIKRQS